jgi:hypothetical protein
MYSVYYDVQAGVIRYRIEGFWTVDAVDAFSKCLLDAIRRFPAVRGKPPLVGDASMFAVQTAPVAEAFQTMMLRDVMPRIGRLALVVATTLNKLQVERSAPGAQMKIFLNEADAIAWLDTPQ